MVVDKNAYIIQSIWREIEDDSGREYDYKLYFIIVYYIEFADILRTFTNSS